MNKIFMTSWGIEPEGRDGGREGRERKEGGKEGGREGGNEGLDGREINYQFV